MKNNFYLTILLLFAQFSVSDLLAQVVFPPNNDCTLQQLFVDCDGLHLRLVPNPAFTLVLPLNWNVTPGNLTDTNPADGEWSGVLPNDNSQYSFFFLMPLALLIHFLLM